ncbi:MAG: hypothetical protein ACJAT6_001759 [Akkermansiaceae bacterium]
MLLNEFGEAFCFERARIRDQVEALDNGIPKSNSASEGVEEGEAAENLGVVWESNLAAKLANVGKKVPMAEGDAFGLSGGTGREEEYGLVIAFGFSDSKEFHEDGSGEELGEDDPLDDLLFDPGQDSLEEKELAVWWPREVGDFADEGVGGDEAVQISLLDRGADGFVGGSEV